jgi:hypothetical protein
MRLLQLIQFVSRPAGIRPQCGHGGTVGIEYLVTLQQVHASHLSSDPLRTEGLSTS